ncbi:type II methionyl aminopeptidase [Methanoplanus endosymbiosus]|uniref:Methionine aminopeptidase n=1 Tax=Methanoplanus endosymbiosus TaxID=33865 RepID=A0A9E7PRC9_9EURY|nr:type II methionyl aminopeptidase [Methanoplanus endosymbiosus]UUX93656.1 type II methionyl aminopeptidase [Methanoplanus endosymbiosus]
MIEEEIKEKYLLAGKIAYKCLTDAASRVKPGVSIAEMVEASEDQIIEMGGEIAFPLNISINADAAHDTPSPGDGRVFEKGDLVKVDLGVHIDGYVADTARTVDLGDNALLVEASREALNTAIRMVKPGIVTGEIGAAVQNEIEKRGFKPVSNLTGHGLGHYMLHGDPMIPSIAINGGTTIEEGMTFAIEPFATTGSGHVSESSRVEIFSQIAKRPVRMPAAKKLYKEIIKMNSLPFARRQSHSEKFDMALAQLIRSGVLRGYPVLHDISGSFVSQAEHTIIVTEDGCLVTTAENNQV